jgi:hypothetical protein
MSSWKADSDRKLYTSRVDAPSSFHQTVLPDDFLLTFKTAFLIRHLALVYSSHYRAHIGAFGRPKTEAEKRELESALEMTLRGLRNLFEFDARYLLFLHHRVENAT